MFSKRKYAELHDFFFRELPRKTSLDMLRLCSLHEKYMLGILSKAELAKIIDDNPKGGKNDFRPRIDEKIF